jgi:hypothetical protein
MAALSGGEAASFASTHHSLGIASYTTVKHRMLSRRRAGDGLVLEPGEDR